MKIVSGNPTLSKGKFEIKIGEKKFFYKGTADHIVFLEELIFKAVIQLIPDLEDEPFSVFIFNESENKYSLMFFNDTDDEGNGNPSVDYSANDFSGERVKKYVTKMIESNNNCPNDNRIQIILSNKMCSINYAKEKIQGEVLLESLDTKEFISGFKKYAKSVTYFTLTVFLLIGFVFGYGFIQNKFDESSQTVERDNKKMKNLIKKEKTAIKRGSMEYNTVKNKKNLFHKKQLPSLNKKIESLGLYKD